MSIARFFLILPAEPLAKVTCSSEDIFESTFIYFPPEQKEMFKYVMPVYRVRMGVMYFEKAIGR